MLVSEADHARISQAVIDAEKTTSGEIVTVIADRSDRYRDIALWWASGAALTVIALLAALPTRWFDQAHTLLFGWNLHPGHHELLSALLGLVVLVFILVRGLFSIEAISRTLTPFSIRQKRCHKRALDYFRVGAERRTYEGTAVLIYVSLAEHQVEIIADQAIHSRVPPESWGEAVAALVDALRDDRPADGLVTAITQTGKLLAAHFPPGERNKNELPDRLIEVGLH